MILPQELINEIVYFVDVKTIILIYKYDTLKSKLTNKIGIDVFNHKLIEIEHMSTLEYQIFLLSTLGQMYHSGFGFNSNYLLDIRKDEYNSELCEFVEDHSTEDDDDMAYFSDYVIKRLSNMIMPFHTIILKNRENCWNCKPTKEWYNEKSIWWKDDKFKDRLLPFLNTRPYITVDDPYMQVTILVEKKGSSLIIDDILFATRALVGRGSGRVIDERGYKVLSKNNGILVLQL